MGFENRLEGGVGGHGFRHEMDFVHDVGDLDQVVVVRLLLEKVAATDNAHDIIEVFAVDGDAGERNIGRGSKNLVDREVLLDGGDHDAWRHDCADEDVIELEGIRDHVGFAGGQSAFFGSFFREQDDFLFVGVWVRFGLVLHD